MGIFNAIRRQLDIVGQHPLESKCQEVYVVLHDLAFDDVSTKRKLFEELMTLREELRTAPPRKLHLFVGYEIPRMYQHTYITK